MLIHMYCVRVANHQDIVNTLENPRFTYNFTDEDFMGKLMNILSKTHRATCFQRSLDTYLLCVQVRWKKYSDNVDGYFTAAYERARKRRRVR